MDIFIKSDFLYNGAVSDHIATLFLAALNNDCDSIAALLLAGHRLDEKNGDYVGMTPVHIACLRGSFEFLQACFQHESFDPWIRDGNDRVPYDHAIATNNIDCARFMYSAMYCDACPETNTPEPSG